MPKKRYFILKE